MSNLETLSEKINNKSAQAAIIGLGYVGLPLAQSICQQGMSAIGLDIDESKISSLESGKSYIDAVSDENIKKWVDASLFKPSNDFSLLSQADFIIICVPTPLDEHKAPDLSYVISTAESIVPHLRPGQIVILESTTYPGTMNEVVKPVLEKSGLKCDKDFYIAYSPERENPGSQNFTTSTIPKVVGADHKQTLDVTCRYYECFIKEIVPVSSLATAEATKILENIFRAVNIALVNELKVIFDKMDLDIWEVIEAAKTKPFGFMPFYPGPGLGGHCIPIDPYYLSWKAKEIGVPTRFIELAGEINCAMPNFVFEKTANALNLLQKKALSESRILILGLAYKKNVADQRETPAFPIMDLFTKAGAHVDYYDPHIASILPNRHYPHLTDKSSIEWNDKNLSQYDAFVILTDHDAIDFGALSDLGKPIIDTRNVDGLDNKDSELRIKA